jgi:hypothetical protein
MEEHPVPQNVTDFEFHLVGDMTLKQFGYLAGGLVSAYLIFVLFGKSAPVVAYPLIVIFALTGTAFAFFPIQQRPLDHWLGAFLNAIFKPTQLNYKSEFIRKEDPFFKRRLEIYLNQINSSGPLQPEASLPQAPLKPNTAIPGIPGSPTPAISTKPQPTQPITPSVPLASPPAPTSTPPLPKQPVLNMTSPKSSEDLQKTVDLAKEAQLIQAKILETERELNKIKVDAAIPGADPARFTSKFQEVLANFQKLNKEAEGVSKKLATISKSQTSQSTPASAPVKARSIPTLTLTAVPNMINGIVTDSLGNYVEGAIVVAHDKQGLPVRALKTNKLGQFIAATPLPKDVYTLNVEKDDLVFDVVEISLDDQALKPIVIAAKKADRSII